MSSFVRTSSLSLKFVNNNKLQKLNTFINDYEYAVKQYIEELWFGCFEYLGRVLDVQNQKYDCPKFCPHIVIKSSLSGRALKCARDQALGIVKAILNKRKKDENKLEYLKSKGRNNKKLEQSLLTLPTKPEIKNLSCELNSILVYIEANKHSSFDIWLNLHSLYKSERGVKIFIPLKKHKQYLKWESLGKKLSSVLLSRNNIDVRFEITKPTISNKKDVVAVDQGIKSLITTSRNDALPIYQNGKWDFDKILDTLSIKQKGSKAFKRITELRKNYINFVLNKLDLSNVCEIKLEKIVNIRYRRSVGRKLSHFTNPLIRDKFTKLCEEQGVLLTHIDSSFNSQRCNKCGWTQKKNRVGKVFKCCACSHEADADENASQNILIRDTLSPIPFEFVSKKINIDGFYWIVSGLFSKDWLEFSDPTTTKTLNI